MLAGADDMNHWTLGTEKKEKTLHCFIAQYTFDMKVYNVGLARKGYRI